MNDQFEPLCVWDPLLSDFERAWESGNVPRIEDYLLRAGGGCHAAGDGIHTNSATTLSAADDVRASGL